jgi:hypothetical protein
MCILFIKQKGRTYKLGIDGSNGACSVRDLGRFYDTERAEQAPMQSTYGFSSSDLGNQGITFRKF